MQDLSEYTYFTTATPNIRAVGWLDGEHAFEKRDVSPADLRAILDACGSPELQTRMTRGIHDCELCESDPPDDDAGTLADWMKASNSLPSEQREEFLVKAIKTHGMAQSSGEVRVEVDGLIYAAPLLIAHYVKAHRYHPPAEFLEGVRAGSFVDDLGKPIGN